MNEKNIEYIDELLAELEDVYHGHLRDKITIARGKLQTLNVSDVSKYIFAIKDTNGEWLKLCATKETAEKELKKYKKQYSYVDLYIDEEILY